MRYDCVSDRIIDLNTSSFHVTNADNDKTRAMFRVLITFRLAFNFLSKKEDDNFYSCHFLVIHLKSSPYSHSENVVLSYLR